MTDSTTTEETTPELSEELRELAEAQLEYVMMSGIYCALFGLERFMEEEPDPERVVEAIREQLAGIRADYHGPVIEKWDEKFGRAWVDATGPKDGEF